jgi:ABC-type sugar transport system ATPase subunit
MHLQVCILFLFLFLGDSCGLTGGVVLISHNQRLISLVCSEIWVVTKAGTVDRFNGEFDDYKEEILAHMDFAGIDDEEEDEEKEREKEKEKRKAKKAEKQEKEDLRPKKEKKPKK